MGVDRNGLPWLGFIEALEDASGAWKEIDVARYRANPDRYRAWRQLPPPTNYGTQAHPCFVPPPPNPEPSEAGSRPNSP